MRRESFAIADLKRASRSADFDELSRIEPMAEAFGAPLK
jgi:hypothetical protein